MKNVVFPVLVFPMRPMRIIPGIWHLALIALPRLKRPSLRIEALEPQNVIKVPQRDESQTIKRKRKQMRIVKIDETPVEKRSGGIFLGTVESRPLVNESAGGNDLKLDIITFPPGVRNKPHRHEYDQVLYILAGEGIVATEKEQKKLTPGYLALIPRGELHWHGATEKNSFQHLSIIATCGTPSDKVTKY